jgi:CHAT domain
MAASAGSGMDPGKQSIPERRKRRDVVMELALQKILASDLVMEKMLCWADSDSSLSYRAIDYVSRKPPPRVGDRLVSYTVYQGLCKLWKNVDQIKQGRSATDWEIFTKRLLPLLVSLEGAKNALDVLFFGDLIYHVFDDFAPFETERILGNTLRWHHRFFNQSGIETEGGPPESPIVQIDASIVKNSKLSREILAELGGRTGEGAPTTAPPEHVVQPPIIPESSREPPARYANATCYLQNASGTQGKLLEQSRPLRVGRKYQLEISVSERPEGLTSEEARKPIRELRQSVPVDILVTLEADPSDFTIPNPVQKMALPVSGGTAKEQNALFTDIEAKRASGGAEDLLSIYVRLFYEGTLLEVMEIRAEAVGRFESDQRSRFDLPLAVQFRQQRLEQPYRDFDVFKPRGMHIDISHSEQGYKLTFTLLKRKVDEEDGEQSQLALTGYTSVPETDLESILVAVRKALLKISSSPCYDKNLECADSYEFAQAMRELVTLGCKLWTKIFRYDIHGSLFHIGEWLQNHPLPERSIIQISHDGTAPQFVLPWNFLYEGEPPDDSAEADYRQLWGLRYSIEQRIPGCRPLSDEPMAVNGALDAALLVWQFPESLNQRQLLERVAAQSSGRLTTPRFIDDKAKAVQFLESGAAHLIHFFAHGHTMLPNAERFGFTEADFVMLYQALPADSPVKQAWQDTYEEISRKSYLSDDSWIKLTNGMLLLDKLYGLGDHIELHNRPLVLLNMCESAQVTPSLAQSFIHFFINRGASTVIGTECTTRSLFADRFAAKFLARWLSGSQAGEAILDTRLEFIGRLNPMGLAYTLFGSATTRLEPPPFKSAPDLAS